MSFLFEKVSISVWALLFLVACSVPLWLKWYKIFHEKFIKTGVLKRKIDKVKVSAEEQMDNIKQTDSFKKAKEKWSNLVGDENESISLGNDEPIFDMGDEPAHQQKMKTVSPTKPVSQSRESKSKHPYVKIILKTVAMHGETGMLLKSIADALQVNSNEAKNTLAYLEENNFIEAVTGTHGTKYFLTQRGRSYAIKKGYLEE